MSSAEDGTDSGSGAGGSGSAEGSAGGSADGSAGVGSAGGASVDWPDPAACCVCRVPCGSSLLTPLDPGLCPGH